MEEWCYNREVGATIVWVNFCLLANKKQVGKARWSRVAYVRVYVFFPTAAPPNLTVDRVVRVVEGVRDLRALGRSLWVPHSKFGENVNKLITYWITTDAFPSWRRLICALDENGEKGIADSVRHYAEPLAGTCT